MKLFKLAALVALAAPAAHAVELRVVTYNLKHAKGAEDLGHVARALEAEARPDFVLLQEVMFDKKGGGSAARTLAQAMGFHYAGSKRKSDQEGVAVLSRYPITRADVLHLKGANPPTFMKRVSVMAEATLPDGTRARVISTHLPNWPWEPNMRRRHVEQTLDWARAIETEASVDVTVFGGDLNAKIDSDEVQTVFDTERFAPFAFLDFNGETPTFGSRDGDKTTRIDFLFPAVTAPGLTSVEATEAVLFDKGIARPGEDNLMLSDHLPVFHAYDIR